jgi:Protein of unknown function (DUF4197)
MKKMKKLLLLVAIPCLFVSCDPATLEGILSTTQTKPGLTNEEVIAGLKEALKVGANNAVSFTSKTDGFFKNPFIKIPFPKEAENVKTFALSHGLQSQVDKFEMNLNRAAEKAAAEAVPVFVNAITSMTVEDGFNILKGDSTAATTFLRKATTAELTQKFSPIVQQAIDQVNLTSFYEPLATAYNASTILTGKQAVNPDLKAYVTEKALNGLFFYVAQEEKKIRRDPQARVSDILKKVFGSLDGKS